MKSTVQFLVDLPFKKIPLYFIPLGLGLFYATRETVMIATSTWLYNQLEEETERREKEQLEKENSNTFEDFSDIDSDNDDVKDESIQYSEASSQTDISDNNSINSDKSLDSEESQEASLDEILEEIVANSLVDNVYENNNSWGSWLWGQSKNKKD